MRDRMNLDRITQQMKRWQKPLETVLFPAVLLLYPFIGVTQGLDLTDTAYHLSNFEFLDRLDPMWLLATWLPNVLGALFMRLPGGNTMLGMNLYCTLVISATLLAVYYGLKSRIPSWIVFVGEWIAASLCWCPRVGLYNYLTYLFLTLGALALLAGLVEKNYRWLAAAGFFLGLNIAVRMPNAVECMLILALWYYGLLMKKTLPEVVRETLVCIGGYLAGFLIPVIVMSAMYGISAYPQMILSLFGMTGGASEYTAGGMLMSILSAYAHTLREMVPMAMLAVLCLIVIRLLPARHKRLGYLPILAGMAVLLRYYYGQGIITRNYWYYDSIFELSMMLIILMLLLFAKTLVFDGGTKAEPWEKLLSMICLLEILITPLGSNNYTFPVLNNLFVAAPAGLWLLYREMTAKAGRKQKAHRHNRMLLAIPGILVLALLFQGTLFHLGYCFMDGADGQKRSARVPAFEKASMMWTTEENAQRLNGLSAFLEEQDLTAQECIAFGKLPGLPWLLDLAPAISTAWPDLDSYETGRLSEELDGLKEEILAGTRQAPVVFAGEDLTGSESAPDKFLVLQGFLEDLGYREVYREDGMVIFVL